MNWISVKDKLPNVNQPVNVARGKVVLNESHRYRKTSKLWYKCGINPNTILPKRGITHWIVLVLPEPP